MRIRTDVKSMLIVALIFLSISGEFIHLRIHHVSDNSSNLLPILSGILSIFVVPYLFSYRKTVQYGYVLNGMIVIIGTIVMAHFSTVHRPDPLTFKLVFLETNLGVTLILWGRFFIGKALFDLEVFGYDPNQIKKGKIYRFPNSGWWIVHIFGLSIVYTLGNILWR